MQYIESAGVLPAERVGAPGQDESAARSKASLGASGEGEDSNQDEDGDKAPSAPPGRKPRANYWESTSASQRTSVRQRSKPDLGMVWLQRAQQLLGNKQLFPSPPAMHGPSMSVGPPPGGAAVEPSPPSLAARHVRLELMATVANMMAVRSRALDQTHTALRHLESALRQEAKLHSAAEADVSTVLDLAKVAHRNRLSEEIQEEFSSAYAEAVAYLAGRRKAYATCHLNAASVLSDMAKHAGATHHSNEAVRLLTTSTLDTALPWQNTERLIISKDENKGGSDEEGDSPGGGGVMTSTASTGGVGVASPGTLLLLAQALYGLAVQQESQKKFSAAVKTCEQGRKALHMLTVRLNKDKDGEGGSNEEDSRGVGGTSLGNLPAVPKGGTAGAPMDKEYVTWLSKQMEAMLKEAQGQADAAEEAREKRRTPHKASTFVQPGRRKGPQEILDRLLATATHKKGTRRPQSSQASASAAYGPGGSRPQSRGSAAYIAGGAQPVRRSGAEVGRNLMMLDPSTGRPRRSQRAEDMHRTQAERLDAPLPEIRGITGEFAVPGLSSAPTPSSGGGGFGSRSAGGRPPKGKGRKKSSSDSDPKEILLPGMEPINIHDLVWAGREEEPAAESPGAPVKPGSLASMDRQSVVQYKESFHAYDLYTQEVIDGPPDTFKEFERAFLPPSVDLHFPPLVPLLVAEAQAGTTSATGFAALAMTAGVHRGVASHTSLGSAGGEGGGQSSGRSPSGAPQRQPAAAPAPREAMHSDASQPVAHHSRPSSQASAGSGSQSSGHGGGAAASEHRAGVGIDGEIHLVRAGDMQTSPHKYGSAYEY